jgi:hypothetical protein
MFNEGNTNIIVICSNNGIQNIGKLTNFCNKFCQFFFTSTRFSFLVYKTKQLFFYVNHQFLFDSDTPLLEKPQARTEIIILTSSLMYLFFVIIDSRATTCYV